MKEILAGFLFEDAVAALKLNCKRTYDGELYSVWEIDDEGLSKLFNVPEEQWSPHWGWFRYAKGCNISHWPTTLFNVNGKPMIGFYNEDDDYCKAKIDKSYLTFSDYLCDVIGASTPKNVCALAVDIAKLNGLTMGELFNKYED